ncbi:Glycosyltransferase involved in cell wall bisynthesis [Algoriphagus faecimaris]|uniref:Glycosyltransferase involved in cell wall bisynthesis n=1 Tax=Algoriphagus faecimaris TaxID=686796 RepID=A0A1G6PRV2_9BACT|nr:glycosyltransferase family 2 protein [Algoriphagus faecimaris]SDC82701.1 Glycosyltransferase involved in cell wall bisynthesis [Algoriphagus faecimaris]
MFSVIIPLYNKAPYIQRAIDSVLNQGFQDFEIIVVNDGSTDGGEELVEKGYGEGVKLIHQKNQGVSGARNTGIEKATYSWIAFLDADDAWHPQYLEVMAQVISSHPKQRVFGSSYRMDLPKKWEKVENPSPKVFHHYFQEAIRNTFFFTSALIYHQSIFKSGIQFDKNLTLGEDLDLFFRAILDFGTPVFIPLPLVYYSQEDVYSEVQKSHSISYTLIPKIFFSEEFGPLILEKSKLKGFDTFREKWVLFNLPIFFRDNSNKLEIIRILKHVGYSYFLVSGFYHLPYPLLNKVFSSEFLYTLFRKYLKFCFRYIYT